MFKRCVWLLIFFGCAAQLDKRPELVEQLLRPRPGYNGLTNSVCTKKDFIGTCQELSVINYDLKDADTRTRLIQAEIVCNVKQAVYRICADKPGICQYAEKGWFFDKNLTETDYIPIDQYQRLLDAQIMCVSRKGPLFMIIFSL